MRANINQLVNLIVDFLINYETRGFKCQTVTVKLRLFFRFFFQAIYKTISKTKHDSMTEQTKSRHKQYLYW